MVSAGDPQNAQIRVEQIGIPEFVIVVTVNGITNLWEYVPSSLGLKVYSRTSRNIPWPLPRICRGPGRLLD